MSTEKKYAHRLACILFELLRKCIYSFKERIAGADWTVGKSVIYRIKFTKKKKNEKMKKKKEKKKKRNKIKNKIHRERPKHIDQKGPLIYALNLTKKGLQIFMRRI